MSSIQYPSQLEYGPYGHLICTPVSCALAVAWLLEGPDAFLPENVDAVMMAAHRLVASVAKNNGDRGQMMMLSELQDRIPTDFIGLIEIAGVTSGELVTNEPVENLVMQPLSRLIRYCANPREHSCALVITMREHTICYLMEPDGPIHHFDPLPALLQRVTSSWRRKSSSGY